MKQKAIIHVMLQTKVETVHQRQYMQMFQVYLLEIRYILDNLNNIFFYQPNQRLSRIFSHIKEFCSRQRIFHLHAGQNVLPTVLLYGFYMEKKQNLIRTIYIPLKLQHIQQTLLKTISNLQNLRWYVQITKSHSIQ